VTGLPRSAVLAALVLATGCSVSVTSSPTASPAPPPVTSHATPTPSSTAARVTGAVELTGEPLVRLAARWPLPGFRGCLLYAPRSQRLLQHLIVTLGGSAGGVQPVRLDVGQATVLLHPRAATAGLLAHAGDRQRLDDGTVLYVPEVSDARYADVYVIPPGDPCVIEVGGDNADDYSLAYGSLRAVPGA
jgi:hypothetical protein